jgi:hypothetical protein
MRLPLKVTFGRSILCKLIIGIVSYLAATHVPVDVVGRVPLLNRAPFVRQFMRVAVAAGSGYIISSRMI